MINVTENYEKVHKEYILALVDYHNAYLKYIHGGALGTHRAKLRKALRKLTTLNRQLIKELTAIHRAKEEANRLAGKYIRKQNGQDS